MISIHTCEFTMETTYKNFNFLLSTAYKKAKGHHPLGQKKKYKYDNIKVDTALGDRGITIEYHNHEYRKQIKVIVNPSSLLGGNDIKIWNPTLPKIEHVLELLNEYLEEYFNYDYELNDFQLTRIDFTSNLKVGKKYVPEYIAVLHKLGKVKYFKPKYDKPYFSEYPEVKKTSFDLIGKTNHIGFSIYDKEADLINQGKFDLAKKAHGILRAEVRLSKRPAIETTLESLNTHTNLTTEEEFTLLALHCIPIFLEWLFSIVPYGDFHTLKKALTIVDNSNLKKPKKKKMKQLLNLIPEKKSLYLAQKELNTKNIDEIRNCFISLNLSPITISKDKKISYLPNLYKYFDAEIILED